MASFYPVMSELCVIVSYTDMIMSVVLVGNLSIHFVKVTDEFPPQAETSHVGVLYELFNRGF